MKRIFGLVGYACNGKSTVLNKIIDCRDYVFIDLPQIYKDEANKNGYSGVTEWYTGVGLSKYEKESKKAVLNYIEKELPRTENLIIDDIFDIDVYNKLKKIFPQIKLIAFHSKYNDRLKRLGIRTGITNYEDLVKGLNDRDNMKKYCGIENIFPYCKYNITNKKNIENAQKLLNSEIKRNLIICIVGYSGSGKSTISYFVSKNLNIPVFEYGKEVSKIIKGAGYSKSRDYVKEKGIESYVQLVNLEIMKNLKKFMKKNKFFIIDGIVSEEVYDKLNKNNDIYSIYINLDIDTRIKRISQRQKISEEEAKEDLETKDGIKLNCGLDIIVSKSNYIIKANNSLDCNIKKVLNLIENHDK